MPGDVTDIIFNQDTFIYAEIVLPDDNHIVVQVELFRETTPNSGSYVSEGTEFSLISTQGSTPRTELWKNVGVSWDASTRYKVDATIQTGYTVTRNEPSP
ncbi:MAG: hypothetical protein SH850_24525 [Planctomycetaceae bacterium]|nr:hypothetical protein [Planctomycetaceae bacterium]